MTKTEFLDKLRAALNGNVSDSLLRENMTYYNEYIDSQIYMGKSEQEVMDLLGDPRLIARTIVQTNGVTADAAEDTYHRENSSYDDYNNNPYGENYSGTNEVKVRTLPSWLWTIIVVLIVICVISFVFKVVSFLLPFVLPVLIVIFFVKLFRDWLN